MKYPNILFIALSPLALLIGCASLSSEPIAAQVVDADTGQPIAGVVVVAHWELHGGSFTGDALTCGVDGVEEAVTDQDGRFHIPGWGPKWSSCDVQIWNPDLIFFKPGYEPKGLNNATTYPLATVSVSRSDWNGKAIQLTKNTDLDLHSETSRYARDFGGLNLFSLGFVVNYPGGCYWKDIPNMLRAVITQEKAFNAAGNNLGSIASTLIANDSHFQEAAPQCGSPKIFIEDLEK
jgi:hypothetical protein